jgi:hypothetical protein
MKFGKVHPILYNQESVSLYRQTILEIKLKEILKSMTGQTKSGKS